MLGTVDRSSLLGQEIPRLGVFMLVSFWNGEMEHRSEFMYLIGMQALHRELGSSTAAMNIQHGSASFNS